MKTENVAEIYELGTRVSQALWQENFGNLYHRQGIINDRWFDSLIRRMESYEKG